MTPPTLVPPTIARLAASPIPWTFTAQGYRDDEATYRSAFTGIRTAGYGAVAGDAPASLGAVRYAELLEEFGLDPAPGYFRATGTLDEARAHAAAHAAVGLASTFVADAVNPLRMARPAVGAAPDSERLARLAEQLQAVVDVMAAEGVRAALHPHVGTWIETEAEIRTVLDTTSLELGADLGHLAWAGADVLALLTDYADRLGPVHVKDVDPSVALAPDDDFWAAVLRRGLWTEIGHGSLDAPAVLGALRGVDWLIVETDVPRLRPATESIRRSRRYLEDHLTKARP